MMRKKKKQVLLALIICSGIIVLLTASKKVWVQALFDETTSVHINAAEIENATLLIGTHLIHISAMQDEIYEIAANSESESNQMERYYKSELADGRWFRITSADSLKDITAEGTAVENQVIEDLFLTHHTRADGITYDLRTGQAVCIFDIKNPYDLEQLSELEPLKLQYDILTDKKDKSKTDQLSVRRIKDFFQMEVQDEETEKIDAQIQGLQSYYSSTEKEKRKSVLETMEALDASRRVIVLEKIRDPLDKLLQFLQGKGVEVKDDKNQSHYFEINSDLNAGVSDSIQKVEESLLLYGAKRLSEGSGAMSREEYMVKQSLASAAAAGDTAGCNTAAERAVLLKSIMENDTKDAASELEYLNGTLLAAAKSAYFQLLTAGAGEEYKQAAFGSDTSQGLRNQALKRQQDEADRAGSELQYLERTIYGKVTAEEGEKFTEELLAEAKRVREQIKEDAFAPYAGSSLDQYMSFLQSLDVRENSDGQVKALTELLEQKNDKQQEKLSALDKNDLAGAKKADAELEELNLRIDVLEKQISQSGEALAGNSDAMPQTAVQSAQQLTKEAVQYIQDGDADGIREKLAGLKALIPVNSDAALAGIQKVYQALAGAAYLDLENTSASSEFQDCMTQAETIIAEQADVLQTASFSKQEAERLLKEVSGSKGSQQKQAALLKAFLSAADQEEQGEMAKMAQVLAARMEEEENPYVFRQYPEAVNEYIPLKAISECLGFRYVFDNYQKRVTLSEKGKYYTFYVFEKKYENGNQAGELKMSAGYMSDIYLWEQDTEELFGCSAWYVPESDLALLVTQDCENQASEYLNILLAGYGG